MYYKTLNNNVKMPQLGFGVFQTPVDETKRVVLDAIEVGYRSFDTAQIYGNEAGVGEAILESGLSREEFFITTKIWISNAGYEKAKASIEKILEKNFKQIILIFCWFTNLSVITMAHTELWKKPIRQGRSVPLVFLIFHQIALLIFSILWRSSQLSIR